MDISDTKFSNAVRLSQASDSQEKNDDWQQLIEVTGKTGSNDQSGLGIASFGLWYKLLGEFLDLTLSLLFLVVLVSWTGLWS